MKYFSSIFFTSSQTVLFVLVFCVFIFFWRGGEGRGGLHVLHHDWFKMAHLSSSCVTIDPFYVQYERPRAVALASSACVDKTTKTITEFTCKDPFLHMKRVN